MFVFEAVQPIKITPFTEWIKRGKNEHYVVKRLKNAEQILTNDVIEKMHKEGNAMMVKTMTLPLSGAMIGYTVRNLYGSCTKE